MTEEGRVYQAGGTHVQRLGVKNQGPQGNLGVSRRGGDLDAGRARLSLGPRRPLEVVEESQWASQRLGWFRRGHEA